MNLLKGEIFCRSHHPVHQPLLAEAYDLAVSKYTKRLARDKF